tara:strand:- start:23 stop:859 length:837 start_codon:yes stop_codon:yes gene_type:complete
MKKLLLGTLAIGMVAITGCEKQRGCTEPNAINFDVAAEENDGSCRYEEDNNSNTDQDSTGTNNGGTDTTNNGSSSGEAKTCQEIEFTWNDVTNPTTGRTWMDRNLGASQVATSSTDSLAYGDLYQWGRGSDGHECRNSDTTSVLSEGDNPEHGDFIINNNSLWDWRSPQNDSLWQGVDGINNPCPTGYRLPTEKEWEEEVESWTSEDHNGAYGSVLKLPMAGFRSVSNGSLNSVGTYGYYWTSTVSGTNARRLDFGSSGAYVATGYRAVGLSVRCLKD